MAGRAQLLIHSAVLLPPETPGCCCERARGPVSLGPSPLCLLSTLPEARRQKAEANLPCEKHTGEMVALAGMKLGEKRHGNQAPKTPVQLITRVSSFLDKTFSKLRKHSSLGTACTPLQSQAPSSSSSACQVSSALSSRVGTMSDWSHRFPN